MNPPDIPNEILPTEREEAAARHQFLVLYAEPFRVLDEYGDGHGAFVALGIGLFLCERYFRHKSGSMDLWREETFLAEAARHFGADGAYISQLINYSLAFIAMLTLGSAVLHAIKLVLGRRRPRDDMEMGLYGFVPFAFNLEYNSFPSGHALTICCVAVIFTCVWPMLWPLWFAIAALLAVTRALLTAHFLSDVLIGAGIGLIAAREVLLLGFTGFAPSWF